MKALVVGLGRMGTFHAKVLADLGFDVETVDPDPTKGATRTYIRRGYSYDAVCIATPIGQLAGVALRAAAYAHPSFMLVEKPFAASLEEAEELAFALRDQHVGVGYVERFNPVIRLVREHTAFGVRSVRFTRHNTRPSANLDLDVRTHDIDLANYLKVADCASYDVREDCARLVRAVQIDYSIHDPRDGGINTERRAVFDLTAHDASPLHAQWHALLSGREGYATPADAITVLEDMNR